MASTSSTDTTASGRPRERESRRHGWWPVLLVCALVLALRVVVAEPFLIPSESMEPGLRPGDRVLVNKLAGEVHRGDVVVFDGATTFGMIPAESTTGGAGDLLRAIGDKVSGHDSGATYVKRVIGVGGDTVACCVAGKLTVNGHPVDEPYLYPGDAASQRVFSVQVPAGRLWFMGDHRSASADSRSHLSAPGGGTVAEKDVVGTVFFRFWPFDRAGTVPADTPISAEPPAPSTGRR